jgi:hypothetical protein
VNLDTTPPVLSISSPANNAHVSTPSLAVVGSITDALSGIGLVACNGIPAKISGSSFSCNISLSSGVNTITGTGTDIAGNSANATVSVTLSMSAPASLLITPGPVNMLVGNSQSFVAVDNLGLRRPDATWSVSNSAIATLASDGSGTLTAVTVGQVTLTATVQGITGHTTVTILTGTSLPSGTVVWSAPAIAGFTVQKIVQAVPTTTGPDLYSVETNSSGDVLVRSFRSDGEQVWQHLTSGGLPFGGATFNAVGENSGGLLLEVASGSTNYLADFDGQTGQQNWRYSALGALSLDVAVALDGTVYAVEQQPGSSTFDALDVINASSGVLANQIQLPTSSSANINQDCIIGNNSHSTNPGSFGPPMGAPDGSINLEVESSSRTQTTVCVNGNPTFVYSYSEALSLLRVPPGGGTQLQTLNSYSSSNASTPLSMPGDVISDGKGGVLASFTKIPTGLFVPGSPLTVADVGPQGTVQSDFTMIGGNNSPQDNNLVLGDSGTAFVTDGLKVVAFNVQSVQPIWTHSSTGGSVFSFVGATGGGGVALRDSQLGIVQLDSSGNTSQSTAGLQSAQLWALGAWAAISNNVLAFESGPDFILSGSSSPAPQGDRAANRGPQLATLVHYVPEDPGPKKSALAFKADIESPGFLPPGKSNPVYRLGAAATLKQFLLDIKNPIQAIGFIGHSIEDRNTGLSVGICLAGMQCLIKTGSNVALPPGSRFVDKIPNETTIFFFATCNVSSTFESLWGIVDGTLHRAIIVPKSVTPVDLLLGESAWLYAATSLAQGGTAGSAKDFADSAMDRIFNSLRWRLIGAPSAQIKQ